MNTIEVVLKSWRFEAVHQNNLFSFSFLPRFYTFVVVKICGVIVTFFLCDVTNSSEIAMKYIEDIFLL